MKLRFYATLVLLLGTLIMNAQDIHFSQFYASPLTLNPALTGNFNGFYRVTGIYRLQYPGLTTSKPAFSTPSVGLDFSLLRELLKEKGALGVGLVFVNDQQNGKTLNFNHILASVAYNMNLAPRGLFQLGVGIQGGVVMAKVNADQLHFNDGYVANQNGGYDYIPSQAGESFGKSKAKGEFNIGIFAKSEFHQGMRIYFGYSFFNATHYKENFVLNSVDQFNIPFRHTIHGGFEFDIKDKAVLIPGILYQNEAKANETNFGLTAGIHVVKDPAKRATIFLGLWNRLNTGNYTLIPKVGFEYKGFRAGFAYDVHLTQQYGDHKDIGGSLPQAFEISLSYIGNLFIPKEDHYLFNPRY